MQTVSIEPLGDGAAVVRLGTRIDPDTHRQVRRLVLAVDRSAPPWLVELVPAFTTVTVFYDAVQADFVQVEGWLRTRLEVLGDDPLPPPREVRIPVCYGGEFGPDLGVVASHNGLTEDEVIAIHSQGEYLVYMIGFAPGFPYLGGLSERIATPRRSTPRVSIPAGTVGIAGMQTGVYPISTPGGWQLIGRTPVRLFRPEQDPPTLLQAGDIVRFDPISPDEYQALLEGGDVQ
ncbi:5-oxoprolinase subunit PxpB [Alicyclobacillus macrosporangiidus]|uniref:5-oxoprolinase subunit PxpB n=1 Tax=Alicyclobacillus macrosporangiidus TaxID=392015 RepID=UPI0026EB7B70|nr:5-oxoprolinase subunit PxpB [Alicyclobacillus macrosporangiidus]